MSTQEEQNELRVKVAGLVGNLQCYSRDETVIIERKNWGWADHLGFNPVSWERAGECQDLGSVPNYPSDLKACAEFEKTLSDGDKNMYVIYLSAEIGLAGQIAGLLGSTVAAFKFTTATADQRCRAFVALHE